MMTRLRQFIHQLEDNKAVVRRFTEAMNNGDYASLDELLAPDFVRHSQATPKWHIRSRDEFKRYAQETAISFPDAIISNEFLVAEGDKVAAYATFSATQSGPMGTFPPSGKRVVSKFLGIIRIEDGKIAELWVEWDNLAMLTQLGVPPVW